jgi:hypothetical protein
MEEQQLINEGAAFEAAVKQIEGYSAWVAGEFEELLATRAQQVAQRGGGTPRDVARSLYRYRRPADAAALLECLVEHGHGRWVICPAGPKGGRPTRVYVPVAKRGESPV